MSHDHCSSTYQKILDRNGNRDDSIQMYRRIINELEQHKVTLATESIDFLLQTLKAIIEVDRDTSIDGNKSAQRLKKALGIDGDRVSEGGKRAEFIRLIALFKPMDETPKQRNDRIISSLKVNGFNMPEERHAKSTIISNALKNKK